MSSTVGADPGARSTTTDPYDDEDVAGLGWLFFAGTMVGIVGVLNFIYGIAAISNSKFFARDVTYVLTGLNTWGWLLLCLGVVQMIASVGILVQTKGARWVGIISAALNGVIQLMVLPSQPFLAVTLFAVDMFVIYGLIAYGARKGSWT